MVSLSYNNRADYIEVFNSTSRYVDDLLDIDNPYVEQMVSRIYPTELQLKLSKKEVNMTRKCHFHTLQTNTRHPEEEVKNNNSHVTLSRH